MLAKQSDEVKQEMPGVNMFKNSPNWLDRSIGNSSIMSSGSDSVSSRESNNRVKKQRAFPGLKASVDQQQLVVNQKGQNCQTPIRLWTDNNVGQLI